jgi:hypothetical protein
MNLEKLILQMANDAQRIRVLVEGVGEEHARWKPAPDAWSILEVVNHLLDEEKLDFRVRLDITLHRPEEVWPGIDPAGWVSERRYNERDLGESLLGFLTAREHSLAWLKSLGSPNWEVSYEAPWGSIRAGDLMAAWVAHDLLHMRQMVELHWAYTMRNVEPYSARYAGEW